MGDHKVILLKEFWPFKNVSDYKAHFGRWDRECEPLDRWVGTATLALRAIPDSMVGTIFKPFRTASASMLSGLCR